jgi:hypothetical protein
MNKKLEARDAGDARSRALTSVDRSIAVVGPAAHNVVLLHNILAEAIKLNRRFAQLATFSGSETGKMGRCAFPGLPNEVGEALFVDVALFLGCGEEKIAVERTNPPTASRVENIAHARQLLNAPAPQN